MKGRYRDGGGKALSEYEHPSLTVDTALLTYDPDRGLLVLEVSSDGPEKWSLPGTFVHIDETLDEAVQRSLRVKANVSGLSPRQLHVFDRLDRDKRYRVVSVGHVAVVRPERLATRYHDRTRLVPVGDVGELPYDHDEIIAWAVDDLRSRYKEQPDPDHLLGEKFTLRHLRLVHEAIDGSPIGPEKLDTFRRRMKSQLHAIAGEYYTADGRGRPAQLFRRMRDR